MVYDYDPRSNRENISSESAPYRLLKDILTHKIADSMANGTASNYLSRSYGSNHRVLFEGVAQLLAEVMIGTLDNLDDIDYTQLRAEFVATRLMYLVFPNEDAVPVGDNHEETISFLLQTYEALLQGATKKAIDEVLTDISEGNAVIVSDVEGYITNIKSAILATTEYNTDGVFPQHRHFTFTDESGLGSTNKPIEFQWGEELHTHDIIDGVVQPYVDRDGNSHNHQVYLGIPENIVRLQSNLRKVFSVTKPAHIKTGEVSSIIDEDIPILAQGKSDVFSPILGIDPTKTDGDLISENTIDPNLPYHNQNALYGLVGLSLGSLYQEDMRKAREGVFEPNNYGYVEGKTIRFWRTNIKVADTLVIGTQKLRVIEVSERIFPRDDFYEPIQDENNQDYTYRLVRNIRVGTTVKNQLKIYDSTVEVVNGNLRVPALINGYRSTKVGSTEILNDGEPIDLIGEIYFCDLMSDDGDSELIPLTRAESGHIIRVSYIEIKVDAQISNTGLQIVKNASSAWQTRDQVSYETVEFTNNPDPIFIPQYASHSINLPAYIVKDMLKTVNGLPISIADLTIKIEGVGVDYTSYCLTLEHTNILEDANKANPQNHVMRIHEFEEKPFVQIGDTITLTYPRAKSEIRRFRELNSIEMTLNAVRPSRKVSLSGRGLNGQNRVIETTSPISYVLNEPQPVSPFTQEQKVATYSAGSSDLLNTKGQILNSPYTLNKFSLNQTATQEQVFKPATKTLTTDQPKISFYELGFRPQFITSVLDSLGTSYAYSLKQDHVLVEGLTSEKTITVSGLSSNPFKANLDWYKGDKLGEGSAFYKQTSTLDLGSFEESDPQDYMTNPLGLVPDQIRSIYSMLDTQTSGVEGELTFYEDVITGYELDGRDGFTNDYNPHDPQDEILYQDPTLYILGPRAQVEEGGSVNTIPTYLYFNYFFLNLFGGDGHYFGIYRIDSQGVKQYQTLTPRADGNGFTAISQYPNLPAPNGSPLAYNLLDDGNGGGFNLNYENGTAPNYIAEINAEFNHIPNETYYLELYMEEDGGGDNLHFFSSGTDADYTLGTDWLNSADTYRLDSELNPNAEVTYTYEITFATNPGEVVSFNFVADPNPTASRESENVGETHGTSTITYYAEDYYPLRTLGHGVDQLWRNSFTVEGMTFKSVEDRVPVITDSHHVPPMIFAPISINSTVTVSDSIAWSLLLEPAMITETVGEITDDVFARFNYNHISLNDSVNVSDFLAYSLNLVKVSESDTVPSPSDSITAPVYQRLVPSSQYPIISDNGYFRWSSYRVESNVSVSDEPLLASLAYVPRSMSDALPSLSDEISVSFAFTPISVSDFVPAPLNEAKAWISSTSLADTVSSVLDQTNTTLNLSPSILSDTVVVSDSITVPVYQTLVPTDSVPSVSDAVNASLHLYLYDSVNVASDDLFTQISSTVQESDAMITIEDTVDALLHLSLLSNLPLINDEETSFISSTNQTDSSSVVVSDTAEAVFRLINPYLFIGLKYNNFASSDNELFSVYKGSMDTLFYPDINEYSPDNNGIDPIGVVFGSKETTINAILNSTAYNNTNDDANIAVVNVEYDTNYTIYAHTDYVDGANDIAVAMKLGGKSQSSTSYLFGEGYTDLMPGSSSGTDRYYLHTFFVQSSDGSVVFTQDSTGVPFTFTASQSIRLYMYLKYNFNQGSGDNNDSFTLREAPANSTPNSPNGTPAVTDGWITPTLHDGSLSNHNVLGSYAHTDLPNLSLPNTNNEAQASWTLNVGTRYHLQTEAGDHDPDLEIYLEARTQDSGASYNTEYSSSDVLDYTETLTNDDGNAYTFNHFFTIRRDGFIIWEQDPSGS